MTNSKKDKTVNKLSRCREGRSFVDKEDLQSQERQRWWSIRHQEAVLFYAITRPSNCLLQGMAVTHTSRWSQGSSGILLCSHKSPLVIHLTWCAIRHISEDTILMQSVAVLEAYLEGPVFSPVTNSEWKLRRKKTVVQNPPFVHVNLSAALMRRGVRARMPVCWEDIQGRAVKYLPFLLLFYNIDLPGSTAPLLSGAVFKCHFSLKEAYSSNWWLII